MSSLQRATLPLMLPAFALRAGFAVLRGPPLKDTLLLISRVIVSSLPVVVVVCFFCGAMLTVQAAASLAPFGALSMSGLIVGFGGVREVFPLLAGGALAARTGAEIASQLQAMRVTRQVEALEMMGLDPLVLLVAPRLIACVAAGPVCVLAAMVSGLVGGQVIGQFQLGIDRSAMWTTLLSAVGPGDLVVGIIKGLVLGLLVGVVACYEGTIVTTEGGARGVGAAANRAVVRGMVLVCLACLGLSSLIYGRFL
ncbi:MAG: ABC transporter permease [Deltaproteobacteria bacterium]|nr:ABC transporter permease [Deltaproteobacteria bacterium]